MQKNEKMKYKFTIAVLLLLFSSRIYAQDTVSIRLTEALILSEKSIDVLLAKSELLTKYWEYRSFKADLLPEVGFEGILPNITKSYKEIQKADGSYTFVNDDYSRISGNIYIEQNIPLTGAKLTIKSSIMKYNQLGSNAYTKYLNSPLTINIEQPIVGFNKFKWLKKIEPLKYKEAKAKYASSIEEAHLSTIIYYFNLLKAQSNYDVAKQNYSNTKKLYKIAEARRKIGQISDNDLLQLKVSLLKSESSMNEAQALYTASMFKLRSFLGFDQSIVLKTMMPIFNLNQLKINFQEVLEFAKENNMFTLNNQLKIIEASRDLSLAKANRANVSLFASIGFSGQDTQLVDTYSNLMSNRTINIGIKVPIIDWGKRKGKVKLAESNLEFANIKVKRDEIDFSQNIYLLVDNYNRQFNQLLISQETDAIAQTRYNTVIDAYMLGKIDILYLNDAQVTKDISRSNFIEQLYLLWQYYYQIRSITLYDFENKCKTITNFDGLNL